jgi:hypothetical protein
MFVLVSCFSSYFDFFDLDDDAKVGAANPVWKRCCCIAAMHLCIATLTERESVASRDLRPGSACPFANAGSAGKRKRPVYAAAPKKPAFPAKYV